MALVAMSVYEPASAKLGGSGGSIVPQTGNHVDSMFDDFNQTLRKNLAWQIVDRASLISQPGYIAAFDKTMKGWQNKMPPGEGQNHFIVDKVMDYDSIRILGQEGRNALIENLKVDAIVVARIQVMLKGTTVMGIGNRRPQAVVSFMVYQKGVEAPIWFEGQILGDEAKESVGSTGFINESLLAKLSLESARSAFSKIGQIKTE